MDWNADEEFQDPAYDGKLVLAVPTAPVGLDLRLFFYPSFWIDLEGGLVPLLLMRSSGKY